MGSTRPRSPDPIRASRSVWQAQVIFSPLHLTSTVWVSGRPTTCRFFVTNPAPGGDGDDIRNIQEPHGYKIRQSPCDLQALLGAFHA